ncbi:MAG TPA: phosphatidylinositol mannoside acyltransferase [Acidimicrobiia bacterium]|nr:phosphatidylinositol mannoside acyltransferase [Acidimicrobiia bacterium]
MVGGAPSAPRRAQQPPRFRHAAHLTVAPARGAYLAYRAGAEVARFLPESVGAPIARGLAQLVGFGFMPARVRQIERNLRRVYGPEFGGVALHRSVAATFDSYGRYFYELFRLPGTPQEWIDAHVQVTGAEHLDAAAAAGRGVVLALPHLGNWDFAGAWLAGRGYPVTVVAEPVEPPELFDWFVETRRRIGMRVIALSPTAGAEALAALRANEAVCLLCDRDLTGDGVDVDFFGEQTTLPAGPATLALRGGAPLIPAGCYFRAHGAHDIRILPPVPVERTGRIRADVARVTQELARRFEELIRAEPEHWHLLQPNWPSDRE